MYGVGGDDYYVVDSTDDYASDSSGFDMPMPTPRGHGPGIETSISRGGSTYIYGIGNSLDN